MKTSVMNETKHSPGPWMVDLELARELQLPPVVYSPGRTICEMPRSMYRPTAEATALLIAAAPKLFSVLSDIRDGVNAGRIRLEVVTDGGNPTAGGLFGDICAAIGQAGGVM